MPRETPGRDLIACLPEYARPAIDSYQATGHLEGENVLGQPIPLDKVPEVEAQLTEQLVQLMAADETPADLAPNQPGVVRISEMGMAEASAWFIGDTREGAVALDATGLLTTAAYAEFSPTAATLVQLVDTGGEKKGTVAAHIDRQDPAGSYLELKDVPEGMLTFYPAEEASRTSVAGVRDEAPETEVQAVAAMTLARFRLPEIRGGRAIVGISRGNRL